MVHAKHCAESHYQPESYSCLHFASVETETERKRKCIQCCLDSMWQSWGTSLLEAKERTLSLYRLKWLHCSVDLDYGESILTTIGNRHILVHYSQYWRKRCIAISFIVLHILFGAFPPISAHSHWHWVSTCLDWNQHWNIQADCSVNDARYT